MTVHIGNYRSAEGEYLDLSDKDTSKWAKEHFPALMATRPVGMSEDYQFMPSHVIAKRLHETFDLRLVEVGQQFSRARDPSGQEHFMKFRLPSALVSLKEVGDSVPEIVIMNSHNGRSKIKAYAGIFRMVCANGMVVSEKSFGQIKLRHFGEKNSFEAFSTVLDGMARNMAVLDARLSKMNGVLLNFDQQKALARQVMKERAAPQWLEPEMALAHLREADAPRADGLRSLWVTFNVLQENLTRQTLRIEPENARPRQIRPIVGARASILTNEKLWNGLEVFIEKTLPDLAAEVLESQTIEGEAVEVKPEPKPARRSATEIIALATYDEICAVTDKELAGLTADERKKLSSRKSYLKKKEQVAA